jgi:hypothetical protein
MEFHRYFESLQPLHFIRDPSESPYFSSTEPLHYLRTLDEYDFMDVVSETAFRLWSIMGKPESDCRVWCNHFTLRSDAHTTFFIRWCLLLMRNHDGDEWILEQGLRGIIGKLFSRLDRYVSLEMEEWRN